MLHVAWTTIAGEQVIDGQHLVRPDGTIGLGIHGNVFVTGMTLTEAKDAIHHH